MNSIENLKDSDNNLSHEERSDKNPISEKDSGASMRYTNVVDEKFIEEDNPIINILGNNTDLQIHPHEVYVSRINSKGIPVMRKYHKEKVESIQIIGNLKLTHKIMESSGILGIPTLFLSYYMRAIGEFVPARSAMPQRKAIQMDLYISESQIRHKKLETAKFIVKKAAYYRFEILKMFLDEAEWGKDKEYYLSLVGRIGSAGDEEALRGIEGSLMNLYFSYWDRMLLTEPFGQRSRQPPKNPPNAALSYLNMQLYSRCEQEVIRCLLDPWFGCLHEMQFNRASFGIDIAELYRPLLVDLVVLRFFRQKILNTNCFNIKSDYCLMNDQGRALVDSHFSYLLDCPVLFRDEKYPSSIRKIIRKQIEAIYAFWRDSTGQQEPTFYDLTELELKIYGKRARQSRDQNAIEIKDNNGIIKFLSVIGTTNATSGGQKSNQADPLNSNSNNDGMGTQNEPNDCPESKIDNELSNELEIQDNDNKHPCESQAISIEEVLNSCEELVLDQSVLDNDLDKDELAFEYNAENETHEDCFSKILLDAAELEANQSTSEEILTEEDFKDIDLYLDSEREHLDTNPESQISEPAIKDFDSQRFEPETSKNIALDNSFALVNQAIEGNRIESQPVQCPFEPLNNEGNAPINNGGQSEPEDLFKGDQHSKPEDKTPNKSAEPMKISELPNENEEPEFRYLYRAKNDTEVYRYFLKDMIKHDKDHMAKLTRDTNRPSDSPKPNDPLKHLKNEIIPFDQLLEDENNQFTTPNAAEKSKAVSCPSASEQNLANCFSVTKSNDAAIGFDETNDACARKPENGSEDMARDSCDAALNHQDGFRSGSKPQGITALQMHDPQYRIKKSQHEAFDPKATQQRPLKDKSAISSIGSGESNAEQQKPEEIAFKNQIVKSETVTASKQKTKVGKNPSAVLPKKFIQNGTPTGDGHEGNVFEDERLKVAHIIAEQIISLQSIIGTKPLEIFTFMNMVYKEISMIKEQIQHSQGGVCHGLE